MRSASANMSNAERDMNGLGRTGQRTITGHFMRQGLHFMFQIIYANEKATARNAVELDQ